MAVTSNGAPHGSARDHPLTDLAVIDMMRR